MFLFYLIFSSQYMYRVSAKSSIFFFRIELSYSSSKYFGMCYSSKVFIVFFMSITLQIKYFSLSRYLFTQPFCFSLNSLKSVQIYILNSKKSIATTSGVSPLKYLFAMCSCTSSVFLWIRFSLLFPELVSLYSLALSDVGVCIVPATIFVSSLSLLASAVSPEPLIFLSTQYLFVF